METSDRGLALIKQHEGLRLEAYPDAGYGWDRATIGYGHTAQAGPPGVVRGMKITASDAEQILRNDLRRFEGHVTSAVHVPLNQNQFDALVSWTFNLGPGNLKTSTMLRKLNAGDYAGAADEMLRWNKSNGKVLAGLTKRREAERALFLTPVSRPATKPAQKPVAPASAPSPVGIGAVVAVVVALAIIAVIFGG
ncbi:MAG TPA: lysozyme [Spongiibacteraceae bacterium]|nr:lysozyme [Spongiibacteraceae bacterium]